LIYIGKCSLNLNLPRRIMPIKDNIVPMYMEVKIMLLSAPSSFKSVTGSIMPKPSINTDIALLNFPPERIIELKLLLEAKDLPMQFCL